MRLDQKEGAVMADKKDDGKPEETAVQIRMRKSAGQWNKEEMQQEYNAYLARKEKIAKERQRKSKSVYLRVCQNLSNSNFLSSQH